MTTTTGANSSSGYRSRNVLTAWARTWGTWGRRTFALVVVTSQGGQPERGGRGKQHDQRQLVAPAELVGDDRRAEHHDAHRGEEESSRAQARAARPSHAEDGEQAGQQPDGQHGPRREGDPLVSAQETRVAAIHMRAASPVAADDVGGVAE